MQAIALQLIRQLFTPAKLTGVEYDVYKVITSKCCLETQLVLRSISRGFLSLVKEVNPNLFRQLLEEGYYSHLFFDKYHFDTVDECKAMLPIFASIFTTARCFIVRKLERVISKILCFL